MKTLPKVLFPLFLCFSLRAANPSFQSFDTNQFSVSPLSILSLNTNSITVFASMSGVPLNSSVDTGGGTSATAAIQTVLDRATNGNAPLFFVLDGAALLNNSNSLVIHSNTTIFCPNLHCGVFLGNTNNCPMLKNDLNTNYSARNIQIVGGTWNGNMAKQNLTTRGSNNCSDATINGTTNMFVVGFWFAGVDNLLIRDAYLRDANVYNILINDSRNILLDNVTCETIHSHVPVPCGTDPFHFIGDISNLRLLNCASQNAMDDVLAFNASEEEQWQPTAFMSKNRGFMTNVYVENIQISTTNVAANNLYPNIVRFQASQNTNAQFHNVTIKGLRANKFKAIQDNTYLYRGSNLKIEDWDLTAGAEYVGDEPLATDPINSFRISNVRMVFNSYVGLVFQGAGTNGTVLENINATFADADTLYQIGTGTNRSLLLSDVVVFGGQILNASGPATLNCVSYYGASGIDGISDNLSNLRGTAVVNGTNVYNFSPSPLVRSNEFALATRYTNSSAAGFATTHAWVSASFQLNAAVAGTAKVAMYIETPGVRTNRLVISSGPLAALVDIKTLGSFIAPFCIWYFVDESSGSGASVAISGSSSSYVASQ